MNDKQLSLPRTRMSASQSALVVLQVMFIATSVVSTQTEVHFIRPTSEVPCPFQQCYTLSEYVQWAAFNMAPETTLIFLPGNHTLDNALIVFHATKFTMQGVPTSHPESRSVTTISCTNSAFLYFGNSLEVEVSFLAFRGCGSERVDGGISAVTVEKFSVLNSTFLQSSSFKSALVAYNVSWMNISTSSFVQNVAIGGAGLLAELSTVYIAESKFVHNIGKYAGGAIFAADCNLHFSGTNLFWRNLAVYGGGGGVYLQTSSAIFDGVNIFWDNAALQGGGLHTLQSLGAFTGITLFVGNRALVQDDSITPGIPSLGGGMIALHSWIIFEGALSFINNTANQGGGLYMELSIVKVSGNSTFDGNAAVGEGTVADTTSGGGLLGVNSTISFDGTTEFVSNLAATDGGAVYSQYSIIHFTGVQLYSRNVARRYGGGLLLSTSSFLTVNGTSVYESNAAGSGGGLYVERGTADFCGNTSFTNNDAASDGGYAQDGDQHGGGVACLNGQISFDGNTNFSGNVAAVGGGIFLYSSNFTSVGSISWTENIAIAGSGGGMFSLEGHVDISNSYFGDNFAEICGGGLCVSSLSEKQAPALLDGTTMFDGNYVNTSGGAICVIASTLSVVGQTTLSRNYGFSGGAILVASSLSNEGSLAFSGSTTIDHNTASETGGAVLVTGNSKLAMNGTNIFSTNAATKGGGAIAARSVVAIVMSPLVAAVSSPLIAEKSSRVELSGETVFAHNLAGVEGGAISVIDSCFSSQGTTSFFSNIAGSGGALNLMGTFTNASQAVLSGVNTFLKNTASTQNLISSSNGGALFLVNSSIYVEGSSTFALNSATLGSAVSELYSNAVFDGSNLFLTNIAEYGGAIYTYQSSLSARGSTVFQSNTASGCYIVDSDLSLVGNSSFIHNTLVPGDQSILSPYTRGHGIIAMRSSVSADGDNSFVDNTDSAIQAMESNVAFQGNNLFTRNRCAQGCGIFGLLSTISLTGTTSFSENKAILQGGGLYASRSDVSLTGETTFFNNTGGSYGGGLHASTSNIRLSGMSNVFLNSAEHGGGGISLAFLSRLYLVGDTQVYFLGNEAQYGAAIHVEDTVNFDACEEKTLNVRDVYTTSYCFFVVVDPMDLLGQPDVVLTFQNNVATVSGTVLYGGLLDRCSVQPFSQLGQLHFTNDSIDVFNHLSDTILQNGTSMISSDPMRICFCRDGEPDCDYEIGSVSKKRGEKFMIPVVAVDQVGTPVPATIRTYLPSLSGSNAYLGDGVDIQSTSQTCTNLTYNLFSPDASEEMILYSDGPCRDLGISRRSINVTFLPCPAGFQLSHSECICEKRLQKFTDTCNIDDESIRVDGDFWVGYQSKPPVGLILHPHCPLDYCKKGTVDVTLADPDTQCAFHRGGVLCGECQDGLSLVFGSSHCEKCSNAYIALIVVFALAGVLLVALLLLLQLTAAVGTVNGLIFYANVVAMNRAIFFPSGDTNILTVFIAWINLDLGIETCFYDGMDVYSRTWLQYVFPAYVWVLVAIIIAISHYCSGRIARVLGRNPVAVLSTLCLLSYAKFLRTITSSLLFTFVEYPNGSEKAVWLYDGNIEYLQGKHIVLFLASLLALLILFLPYTLVLLLGQWLQKWSDKKLLRWANSKRLRPFLDAYHGPFETKHRYWTGLLLFMRCVLFITFALNISGDPSTNLLLIASVTLGITVLTRVTGQIYNTVYLDILEASFLLNLGILAAATHHVRLAGGNQAAVVYTSVGIAFISFIGILVYHMYTQEKDTKLVRSVHKWLRQKSEHHAKGGQAEIQAPPEVCEDAGDIPVTSPHSTTVTVVSYREPLFELLDMKGDQNAEKSISG